MRRKALSVAEKPSVAKELASILSQGRHSQRSGPATYNKIFEFDGTLDGGPCQMMITSVLGHLMEHDFDEQHRKWNSCEPIRLFDAPILTSVRKADGGTNYEQRAAQPRAGGARLPPT